MAIRVRFMLNETTPLPRIRIRYRKSAAGAKRIDTLTDEEGFATINRRERRRAINVDVFAQNPAVTVVTGPMNTAVRFDTRVVDDDVVLLPNLEFRNLFEIGERARTAYNDTFRNFGPFGGEFPFGNNDLRARQRIRLVFPDQTPGNASWCDPGGFRSKFPVVHIDRADALVAGTNTLDATGNLDRVVTAEMTHAVHFGTIGARRRKQLRRGYLVSLLGESAADLVAGDPVGRWGPDDPVSNLMAYIEAFDMFGTRFRAATGATLVLRIADFLTNATAVGAALTNFGRNVPGAVFSTIFVDYAGTPGIGLEQAIEQYVDSRALTYGMFRRWVRRRFGAGSTELAALDAAGATWGM